MYSIVLSAIAGNGTSIQVIDGFETAEAAASVGEQWIKYQSSASGSFSYVVYSGEGWAASNGRDW